MNQLASVDFLKGEMMGAGAIAAAGGGARAKLPAVALGLLWMLLSHSGEAFAQAGASNVPIRIVPSSGHSLGIESAAITPDGRLLVSSGGDEKIKLWDARSGRVLRTLVAIKARNFTSVAGISPNGRFVLGRVSGEYKIWKSETGAEVVSLQRASNAVISGDGRRVASIDEKLLRIWDTETGKSISTLKDATASFDALAISANGNLVATAGADRTLRIWDADGEKLLRSAKLDGSGKFEMQFSTPGERLLVRDGAEVRLLDPASLAVIWKDRVSGPTSADFSPAGDCLVVGAEGSDYKLVKAGTGQETVIKSNGQKQSYVSFSGDGRRVFFQVGKLINGLDIDSGSVLSSTAVPEMSLINGAIAKFTLFSADPEGRIEVWDLDTGTRVAALDAQVQPLQAVLSKTGTHATVVTAERDVLVGDASTGRLVSNCGKAGDSVNAVAISRDNRQVIWAGDDRVIAVCDAQTGAVANRPSGHEEPISALTFSNDGTMIASGAQNGAVKLYNLATGQPARSFKGTGRPAMAISFSSDGKRLAVGTDDNKVRIFDLTTGKEIHTLRMMVGPVYSMAISPDGRRLAAGSLMFAIKQWDIQAGKELARIENGGDRDSTVAAVAFSPTDAGVLASAYGNRLVLWNPATGRQIRAFNGVDEEVRDLAFSADGKQLISIDNDGIVKHWNVATGSLVATSMWPSGNEWIVLTPEGFFDASSPQAARNLTVVRGLDVLSIDQIYASFYRPDLVREKLAGDPTGKVTAAAAQLERAR